MNGAPWRAPTLPIATWLPSYSRDTLGRDVLAAGVVAALTIPQALGYAAIAGVPVQVGLYAIPVALIAYAVLGSSPHVMVGPVSTVSVVSGSLVAVHAAGDPELAVAVTVALAILSGIVLLVAGVLRLGWIAEFLSKPIISGFVFGLSVLIILGELPTLLGMEPGSGGTLRRLVALVSSLGTLDPTTAAIGVGSLAVLVVGSRLTRTVPWGLLLVAAALLASGPLDLEGRGVAVVGAVPGGLPAPSLPSLPAAEWGSLVVGAAGLALVGLAESLSAARLFAAQGGYRVDADQEFVATGAANIASGLFGGLGVAGSLSKTAAVVRSGGNSQVVSLAAASLTLVVLLLFAPSLSQLPRAVLAAIVIHAVWGLIDVPALRRYKHLRRNDFVAALSALLGVLLLGTLYGLLAAVAQSVAGLIYRTVRVDVEEIGRIEGEKAAWGSVRRHPERRTIDGIEILRLSAPLFWVNATTIEDLVLEHVDARPGTRSVILDLEATNQLDTTSADTLERIHARLARRGIDLTLVRVMRPARQVLRRSGLLAAIGEDQYWHTISAGVAAARKRYGIRGWADPADTHDGKHHADEDAVD